MLRRMWKTVETKAGKVRIVKAKGREEERSRKKIRRKRRKTEEGKEKTKERKKDEGEESSRRMGDFGREGESSKIRSRGKKVDTREIP